MFLSFSSLIFSFLYSLLSPLQTEDCLIPHARPQLIDRSWHWGLKEMLSRPAASSPLWLLTRRFHKSWVFNLAPFGETGSLTFATFYMSCVGVQPCQKVISRRRWHFLRKGVRFSSISLFIDFVRPDASTALSGEVQEKAAIRDHAWGMNTWNTWTSHLSALDALSQGSVIFTFKSFLFTKSFISPNVHEG